MRFAELCALCRHLESTRSRLEKVALTADFLPRLESEEISWAVAFLTGRSLPVSDPRVLELSWRALEKLSAHPIEGDQNLSITEVGATFVRIAEATGKGSRQGKLKLLAELFGKATDDEQEILRRILHGEMRIGLHDGLVEEAVAKAASVDLGKVRRAALFLSDIAQVARIAMAQGAAGLTEVRSQVFTPLLPMLSELANNFAEILSAHGGKTALEFKYDGARLQIHKSGDVVRIWSRRLTEVTSSLPDIVALARGLHGESFILDGEVVATGKDKRP